MTMLKKWSIALCERSLYKQDFGNIKLMATLLRSKGFPIPEVEQAAIDAIAANEENRLKGKEEIKAEERVVLETRLEELLNRGQPADLVAANALMKKIVGYSNAGENIYSSTEGKIDAELNILGDKIELLESMMEANNYECDEYKQLYEDCKSVIPRMFQLANSELSEGIMSTHTLIASL